MIRYRWDSLALAWTLILCTLQASPSAVEPSVLNRPVALNHLRLTTGATMSLLLSEAQVPGGIISIYEHCEQPNEREFSLDETTLKQALDYISTIESTRTWTYKDGLILVGLEQSDKTILRTVIHDVDFNPTEALTLSAQRLLETPEVRTSIQNAELNELSPELGFGQIRKNPSAASLQSSLNEAKHLHEISLLHALNVVAATKGTGVWEYEQFNCSNRTSFRLNWAVK